jgi:mRNA interferase RelE/StbE
LPTIRVLTELRSSPGRRITYRIRVGDYRILYEIHDDVLIVYVIRVGHRRDVYR